ncbi:2Fe-2S iron-sulfur cluster-binding protein [Nocardia noduli]|uniref:2Fe-2S iron-sulfur cluster-binding protein n=1 Tax=Nocardia noduli TaxID=2815722 RepID=UPI001C23495D|nr:2Fe-2S iron-sulfur cluster binding domain-containing protein [Nocardia noduli]
MTTDTRTSTVTLTGYGADLDVEVPRTALILDVALRQREDLPYSCLGGSCGTCIATVESGRARMEPDPLLAIIEDEIDRGLVLACRARPVSDEVTLRFGR